MFRTTLVLSILLGAVTATISADSAREPDLTGVYVCTGTAPDGSTYEGLVEIVKHNDAFQLVWFSESEVVAIGMGIRTGNVLAVAYYSGLPGVVAYRIEEHPGNLVGAWRGARLVGEWTVAGAEGVLSLETLTKMPSETLGPSVPPWRPEPAPPPDRRRHL